ncbi:hypothetical protein R1T43_08740 [Alteromonas sp. CI.11.F.A3]|uniref:hypothetical protein n=1 Tax=Alteromonas sp. CI.11.F.A3 TaxID=3079555 RepID=UPI00294387A8|nr:hypothetical protein [Alteromonas sp. CI.11.F.A3]WOI39093.1 hypothetical protein R1T43_08740 [Alteromonas sp. CI.11.F.A3]
MKKFIIGLFALVGFSAQAAVINISTDQASYSVGDTVTATVNLDVNAFLALSGTLPIIGLENIFTYDPISLTFTGGSVTFGDSSGFTFFDGLLPGVPGMLAVSSVGFFPLSSMLEILEDQQSLAGSLDLYTLNFSAVSAVNDLAFGVSGTVLNSNGVPLQATTSSSQFSITEVPAPSTGVLALLACFGMMVSRVKVRR